MPSARSPRDRPVDSEPRGSGIAWIDAFARSLPAPPLGAVVAPDLSGRDDAVGAAAARSGRAVLHLRAQTSGARRPLGVLEGALGAGFSVGGSSRAGGAGGVGGAGAAGAVGSSGASGAAAALEALLAAATGGVIVALDAHAFDDETVGVLVDLVPAAASFDVGLLVASRPVASTQAADLIAAVAAGGPVVRDVALTVDDVGTHLARRAGGAVPTELVHAVAGWTAGRLGLVDLMVDATHDDTSRPSSAGSATGGARATAIEVLVAHFGVDSSAAGSPSPTDASVVRAATALSVHLDRLAPDARRLLVAWSLLPDAGDDLLAAVLADAQGGDGVVVLRRTLGISGLLAVDGASVVPLVARLLPIVVDAAELRNARRMVARALADGHGTPEVVAGAMRAAGATGFDAAEAYLAAARAVGHRDPAVAEGWFDAAVAAGAEAAGCAAERGELAAIAGDRARARDHLAVAFTGPDRSAAAAARVAGVLAWRDGHGPRAARHLADAATAGDPNAASLAAVVNLALGSVAPATFDGGSPTASPTAPASAPDGGPPAASVPASVDGGPPAASVATEVDAGLRALVAAVELAVAGDPHDGLAGLLEAAALLEGPPTPLALPELVSAMAAATALTIGDRTMASAVLERTAPDGGGGLHHHSRLGWQDLIGVLDGRAPAQPDEAAAPADPAHRSTDSLAARDGVVAAAVAAGWARRTSDVAALHDAWCWAEPLLVEVHPDLWLLHPTAELAAAAARLDTFDRAARWLDSIDALLDRVGADASWRASLAWARLGATVAAGDVAGTQVAADALGALGPLDGPLGALEPAARCWVQVLGAEPDEQTVLEAADGLDAAGRRNDAARLVGQAAVRVSEPAVARRLLSRARELGDVGSMTARTEQGSGVLSDRELEVARLVVDGHTYKQIGAQLYVSPKTVEHHVARIRTKLGAADRAEMLAALRRELGSDT